MRRAICLSAVLVCSMLWAAAAARAENWPGWRGPRGDGTSHEQNIPVEWDGTTGKNIVWQIPLPGEGLASPVVWEDRVFLASCLPQEKQRILQCFDRRTGKQLWRQVVVTAPLETKHSLNSHASGTPATDGQLVYVTFLEVDGSTIPAPNVGRSRPITPGKILVAAYTLDGELQWKTHVGEFISAHGFCSCPVLFENTVIVNGDHDGESYIVALERETGKTVWKQPRRYGIRSYVTPLIRTVGDHPELILSGSKSVEGLNPRTGERLWSIEGPTEQFVASMVTDGERFFLAAGFPTYHVMAVRGGGSGDVSETHVDWHVQNARCYVPSPVVVGEHLMVADDRGTANCFETKTGERLWQDRLGRHFSASLATAGGLAYFIADDGITKVVRPGKELDVVATNPLGEFCRSSPAMSQGSLFLRGEKHLFRIGQTDVKTSQKSE